MTLRTPPRDLTAELQMLEETRRQLIERLDRVLSALTLTIDAQAAVTDQLFTEGRLSADRAANVTPLELLAERCRGTLRALRDS